MSNVNVIHHNDADGYMSAVVVHKYLANTAPDAQVQYHMINYNHDLTDLLATLRSTDGDIYVVDIRLREEYMKEFADRIIWIDHHESAIAEAKANGWFNTLKKSYSRMHMTPQEVTWFDPKGQYSDPDEKGQVKIAGCELAFASLLGTKEVPLAIVYTGRYDTWHHKECPKVLGFQKGLMDHIRQLNKKADLKGEALIAKLSQYVFGENPPYSDFVTSLVNIGTEILEKTAFTHAKEAPGMVSKQSILGGKYTVLLVNRGSIGSSFWASVLTPDADALMCFQYKPKTKNWTGNLFGNPQSTSGVEALTVLQELKKTIKFTSAGGHADACGFTVTDINDLLAVFD